METANRDGVNATITVTQVGLHTFYKHLCDVSAKDENKTNKKNGVNCLSRNDKYNMGSAP